MPTYLNNALDGWTRPDEETHRVRAGAFVLSLEQFRHRGRWEADPDDQMTDAQWDDHTWHCTVRCVVYDAFAYLACQRNADRQLYYRLEQLAYEILTHANERNEKAVLDAADAMAALTPYWVKKPFRPTP